jgi:hypothetical protein
MIQSSLPSYICLQCLTAASWTAYYETAFFFLGGEFRAALGTTGDFGNQFFIDKAIQCIDETFFVPVEPDVISVGDQKGVIVESIMLLYYYNFIYL